MRYVGLDAHWRQSTICVLDDRGRKILSQNVRGPWSKVLEELGKIRKPFEVCFEASTGYGYLFEQLQGLARRVVVAHPGQLRLIFRSKRKNDRVDAEKLAKLLFLDEVPPVHVPREDVRAWRRMIGHRRKLVASRIRSKNAVRALLRSQGIEAPKGLWTHKGMGWLRTVSLATELDELQRDILCEQIKSLTRMIQRAHKLLNGIARRHPAVQLLKTIPGVGVRTAEAVVAHIDDPKRFHRIKTIGRYFGLVPSQDASGPTNRLGHITREGPSIVRYLITEAAWQGIRRSQKLRALYDRVVRKRFRHYESGSPSDGNQRYRGIAMRLSTRRVFAMLVALFLMLNLAAGDAEDPQSVFFERLHALCGARFEGRSTFPEDPGEAFGDKKLVAVVETCGERVIRIPFRVGEDTSRTWILTRVEGGLELKHDHRHPDGTPDEITMYGGTSASAGTGLSQSFPADEHTAALIPEARSNEWFLSLSEDGSELTYYLERHGEPRFRAVLQRMESVEDDSR